MQTSEPARPEIASSPASHAEEPPPEQRSNRSALLIVFLVVFIDLLGFGIVLPLLPRYADTYLQSLFGESKEGPVGGMILGALMSSFSLMQFVFAPIWGQISDRIGRRPILLVGLAGSVVFYMLFGYASDLPAESTADLALFLLFVARIGAGIAGATIPTAQAVIADSTPPERRKHGMALIGAAFGIGFTFGPLIGFGSLTWFPDHPGVVGYVAAGLSGIALLLAVRLLPETRRTADSHKLIDFNWWVFLKVLGTLFKVLSNRSIRVIVFTFFLATFGFAMFEPTLALLIKDALKLRAEDSFLLFAYVGFVLVFTQGFIYRRLAKNVTEPTFMFFGILLMGLGLVSLGGMTWLAGLPDAPDYGVLLTMTLVSLAVAVMGFAFLTPSAQALVSRRTDAERQGEVLGANQSAAALARILGPFFGLVLYKAEASHMLPYFVGAALVLLMLPLIPRIRRG
jgi:MFS family permease